MNLKQTFYNQIKHDNNDDILKADNLTDYFNRFNQLLKQVLSIHEAERLTSNITYKSLKDHSFKTGIYSQNDMYFIHGKEDYYFIGDIHSDSFILEHILEKINFFEKVKEDTPFKLIFLGDYVDRGNSHMKTVEILLTLKVNYPKHIILLMGNHDIGDIKDGEVTLYLRKMEEEKDYFYYHLLNLYNKHDGFTEEILNNFLKVMNTFNVTAFIQTDDGVIQGVHGGIPRPDQGFKEITALKAFTDQTTDSCDFRIRDCLLWSDPSIQDKQPPIEKKRFKFYQEDFNLYKDTFGVDLLIRGHQAMEDGFMDYYDDTLYTIFSTGVVLKDEENMNHDTRYDFVTPKILRYNHKKGLPLEKIDLSKYDY